MTLDQFDAIAQLIKCRDNAVKMGARAVLVYRLTHTRAAAENRVQRPNLTRMVSRFRAAEALIQRYFSPPV